MTIPVFQSNAFQTNAFAQNSPQIPSNNSVTPAEIATPTDAYACTLAMAVSQTESVSPSDILVNPRAKFANALTDVQTVSPSDTIGAGQKFSATTSSGATQTPSILNTWSNTGDGTGTTVAVSGVNTTGSNSLLVALVGHASSGSNGAAITGVSGNSLGSFNVGAVNNDFPNAFGEYVYYKIVSSSVTSETITATWGAGTSAKQLVVLEITGYNQTSPIGSTVFADDGSGMSSMATPTTVGGTHGWTNGGWSTNSLILAVCASITSSNVSLSANSNSTLILDTVLGGNRQVTSFRLTNLSTTTEVVVGSTQTYGNLQCVGVEIQYNSVITDCVVTPVDSYNAVVLSSAAALLESVAPVDNYDAAVKMAVSVSEVVTALDGHPLIPSMPVINRNVPAYASSSYQSPATDADKSNDDDYTTVWRSSSSDTPPIWVAYDLNGVSSASKTSVRLVWYNESNGWWYLGTVNAYGVPGSYTVDAHASTSGTVPTDGDAGWVNLATVTGNIYGSRSHDFSLTGYNWVRVRVTAKYAHDVQAGVSLWCDIHDISGGSTDHIGFIGDSISSIFAKHDPSANGYISAWQPSTAYSDLAYSGVYTGTSPNLSFYRLITTGTSASSGSGPTGTGSNITDGTAHWQYVYSTTYGFKDLPQIVNLSYPNFPITESNSHDGTSLAADGSTQLTQLLAGSSFKILCIEHGMNDGAGGTGVYDALNTVVNSALASGVKAVVIGLANWTNDTTHNTTLQDPYTGSSTAVNPQIYKYRNDARAAGLPVYDGPDLWTKFFNHPEYLRDGAEIHPTSVAMHMIQEMWAEALVATIYKGTLYDSTKTSPNATSQLETVTPSDNLAANQQMPSTFGSAETATPTESIYPTLGMPATVGSEIATPTYTLAAGITYTGTASETVTPSESQAAGIIYTGSGSETVTPSESEVPGLTFTLQLQASETTTPSDGLTPGLGISVTLGAETATPKDNYDSTLSSASGSTNNAVTPAEIATPTDNYAANLSSYNTVSETVSPTDSLGTSQSTNSSLTESVSPSDSINPGLGINQTQAAESASPLFIQDVGVKFTLTQASETVSPIDSELAAIAATVTLSETVTPTDAETPGLTFILTQAAEVATPTDGETAGAIYQGTISETVTPSDQLDNNLRMTASQSETVSPTDQQQAGQPFFPGALTETVTPTEQEAVTLGLSTIALTESVSPTDTLGNNAHFWSTETETVQPLDSVDGQLPGSFTQLESVSALDGYAANLASTNSLSEVVSPTDVLGNAQATNSSQAETVSPTDTLASGNKFTALLGSEVTSPTDAIAATQAMSVSQTETVSATESSNTTQATNNSEVEIVTPTESQTGVLPGSFSQVETVSAVDNYDSNLKSANTLGTESVSPTDSIVAGIGSKVSQTETVSPTESQSNLASFSSTMAESVTATDGSGNTLASTNSQAETVTPTESLGTTQKTNSSQTEAVSPIDVIDLGDRFTLTETADTATPTDSQAAGTGFSKTFSESVSASDSLAASQRFATGIEEDVTAVESQNSSQKTANSQSETVSAVDSYAAGLVIRATQTESVQALESSAANLSSSNSITEVVSVVESERVSASLNASETLEEIVTPLENQDSGQVLTGSLLESTLAPDPVLGVPNPGLTTHGFNAGFNEGVDSYFN